MGSANLILPVGDVCEEQVSTDIQQSNIKLT
jgi:hypothetical protein